jgi:2-polyprenyl-6-methoxyphenol hydroxylase-like FAD-dependent oxidoreductase
MRAPLVGRRKGFSMYDAIVVGARCAGAPTAMLLARHGYRVLLLDKATFPSDKLSTHYIQPGGVKQLEKWGVLDAVKATNCPPLRTFKVFMGDSLLMNAPQEGDAYCPRRYLLDKILVDAAVAASVELRQAFTVDAITREGATVTGIAGHARGGDTVTEAARIVIGADSHHSIVAKAVNAPKYREREALTGGYYSYFSGVPMEGAEVHVSPLGGVLAFPTNDGQVCRAAGGAKSEWTTYRADIEGTFWRLMDGSPDFAARVRGGKREERFVGTVDVPNFFRKPWGPGWALVGDAGYMKDPTTGLGIADAFRDAELLADALHEAWKGARPWDEALGDYQAKRDAAALPMYEVTLQMASGQLAEQLVGLAAPGLVLNR